MLAPTSAWLSGAKILAHSAIAACLRTSPPYLNMTVVGAE